MLTARVGWPLEIQASRPGIVQDARTARASAWLTLQDKMHMEEAEGCIEIRRDVYAVGLISVGLSS